ncbi:MAG: type II secretion system F family protein, partial [Gemmatimonadota bacterium]
LGACAPYLMLVYRRKKRLERFLAQFPDAIDLMARAVRAGHAIVAGFDMIAEELDDPVGEEFRQLHDEQKFGLPLHQVLANLQERVPLLDVRMLSTAIQIQREVGGNLAEVLDNIAHTIRERFKIHRQIRVYTAQGRLTGYILAALPIFLGLGLMAVNPGYFKILFEHEAGSIMIGLAALLQILGYFWIRKIVNIKI